MTQATTEQTSLPTSGCQPHHDSMFMLVVDPSCAIAEDGYGILASFDDPSASTTGSAPIDNVTISSDGATLYGMTQSGGCHDPTSAQNPSFGTVFSIPSAP